MTSFTSVEVPVTLPSGRARLATRPAPTGSPTPTMTMGIVAVAFFAASDAPNAASLRTTRCEDRCRGVLRRQRRLGHHSDDDVHLAGHQFRGKFREPLEVPVRRSIIDTEVTVPHVPELAQFLPERFLVGRCTRGEKPDAGNSALCSDCNRGSQARDDHATHERAPIHHRSTSSARKSSDCGSVRPSAFAVFRLITSSSLSGCSIASSPGLAPRKIRSTYFAARR